MSNRALAFVSLCSILAIHGCSTRDPIRPNATSSGFQALDVRSGPLFARRSGVIAATEVRGEIGPGTEYALFRPENWNGDLVLYAHGYVVAESTVGTASTEALQENLVALRELLLGRGYAVGYSSYSTNGFAVKEGALWTGQLREIAMAKIGRPDRTFVIGQSLGGLVAVMLAETHPSLYAGALSVAGILGGSRAGIDYHANIRILFDLFYPNVLPGSLLELPDTMDLYQDIIAPAAAAMTAHPEGAFAISQITQTPVPFPTLNELGPSIIQSLVFHAIALEDLLSRTHGQSFFDNRETVYTGTLPPEVLADVNARVQRYTIAASARAYLERYYEPTGRIQVPVHTLHLRWDPIAPLFHETIYHDRVAAAPALGLLQQEVVDEYGHPGVSAPRIAEELDELAAQVGVRSRAAMAPLR